MGALRVTIRGAPAETEDILFELLAGIPCSWSREGDTLSLWAEQEHAGEIRAALAGGGLSFTESVEEDRDWIAQAAALQKAVVVGRYLLDPHEGALATPAEGRVRLHVPAERAFGTGSHESTRIALRLLLARPLAGERVLDVGCGAGTLAFVASREGASRAVALDIDPDAAFATRAGARRNGTSRVAVLAAGIEALAIRPLFDVAVANMIAEELTPLLGGIARRLVPGGTLVTSGQLGARREEFEEALRAAGYEPRLRQTEGEWIGFVARRT